MCGGKPLKNPTDFCSMLTWFTVTSLHHGKSFFVVEVKSFKIFFFLKMWKKKYFSRVFIFCHLIRVEKGTHFLSLEFSLIQAMVNL